MFRAANAVCRGFARKVRGRTSEAASTPTELKEMEDTFVPLQNAKSPAEPTNKLLKEIQKELVYPG
jgi:hypothetical protein